MILGRVPGELAKLLIFLSDVSANDLIALQRSRNNLTMARFRGEIHLQVCCIIGSTAIAMKSIIAHRFAKNKFDDGRLDVICMLPAALKNHCHWYLSCRIGIWCAEALKLLKPRHQYVLKSFGRLSKTQAESSVNYTSRLGSSSTDAISTSSMKCSCNSAQPVGKAIRIEWFLLLIYHRPPQETNTNFNANLLVRQFWTLQ